MATYNILDFGAVGNGTTLDTTAIQSAIDACTDDGGGVVLVPGGHVFLTGTFRLKSKVEFHLENGAHIIGSLSQDDYPNQELRCLVEANNADDIAITGFGVIDGRGTKHMVSEEQYMYRGSAWRPRLMGLIRCNRVTVQNVTLKDSANWGLHMTGCNDVLIHGIRILNDLKVPNCDGIDPDHCRNVRISDCHIEAGDDCIVLKNTKDYPDCGPTENITISNCTMVSTSAAVKIGTESIDDFRNIVVQNCTIGRSSRGLTIQLRDQGNVENVLFQNITVDTRLFYGGWWGRAEPIYVTAIHRSPEVTDWNPTNKLGYIRNVRFQNILCKGENGVYLEGSPDSPLQEIVLDNVRVEVAKTSKWPGGQHDRRPCTNPDPCFGCAAEVDPGLISHPTVGIYCQHANDVIIRDTKVVWGENPPEYYSAALECHDVTALQLDNFTGDSAHPGTIPSQIID
ncbi:MAG: glycosyl hydrolase family 28 protein [bacterium]